MCSSYVIWFKRATSTLRKISNKRSEATRVKLRSVLQTAQPRVPKPKR